MSDAQKDAIDAVQRFVTERGLAVSPSVVADRSNLVLRLAPLPIVARVAMATSAARVGMDWLAREVEVSRFLGPALSTVPSDLIDAGPHRLGDHIVSFWVEEETLREIDPLDAGRALHRCHARLKGYPAERLPYLGAWDEVRAVKARLEGEALLTPSEMARIERAFARAEATWDRVPQRSASMQAIHGDAHLGNVLGTARGPIWTDWEDTFVGPIEYDLASLRSRAELFGEDRARIDAACAAYGPHDAALVRELGLVRNVQVILWLTLFALRQPELLPRVRARIAALERDGL